MDLAITNLKTDSLGLFKFYSKYNYDFIQILKIGQISKHIKFNNLGLDAISKKNGEFYNNKE